MVFNEPITLAEWDEISNDTLFDIKGAQPLMVKPPKIESIKVETPLGSVESDSGNHGIDIITIVGIIVILYIGKKLVDRYILKG